jgi:dihydrolipoamide dehydrogenase
MQPYDVAVLGAGPGGYVAALRAAARGARVCCIEAGRLGGTCLNVGCIPTKAMLHASQLHWNLRHASAFGINVADVSVDGAALMRRVAGVVAGLGKGVAALLKTRKVDVLAGRGRLTAPDTLAVEGAGWRGQVKAKSIIVATGSRAVKFADLPWESGRVMTTQEAATAKDLPRSVLIIGGGIIGCEFATFYSELGIPTTVVEMLDRLVAVLDDDASAAIARGLQARKVDVLTGMKVAAMSAGPAGLTAELTGGRSVQAEYALLATGRTPNTDGIGLEELGIAMDGKVIRVDDRCRTNVPNVYAIGDVAEARQYAHLASRMGIVAADNAAGLDARDSRAVVPAGVYTHPEVATVGLTEAQARRQCPAARVSRFPYLASGMAQACGRTEGFVKLIADGPAESRPAEGGAILGAVVVGQHATEVIHEIALAMRAGLGVQHLADCIHTHPTFSEAVGEAAEAWLGLPLHVAK